MTPLERVVAALEAKGARGKGRDWQCPAHEDARASLSLAEGDDGRALLRCHAGCGVRDIAGALGLQLRDLFPEGDRPQRPPKKREGRVEAVYPYHDEAGRVLFEVVRFEPKRFAQRRPDPGKPGGLLWSLDGVRRVPFRLPQLLAAVREGRPVWLTEGEKDALALVAHGLAASCNPGGADPGDGSKWLPDFAAHFAGAHARIVPDGDEPGRKHARFVAAQLHGVAGSVRIVDLARPGVKDPHDFFASGGAVEELEALAAEAPPWSPAAEVDGAQLLEEVRRYIRRHVVVTDPEAVALTLWVAHTWATEAADVTPYVAVMSPERQCGKTRLGEVLATLVRNPWRVVQPTEAVLFRKIHKAKGAICVLFDEVDTVFSSKASEAQEGVRAILNAGFQRGETVPRCIAHGDDVEDFEVFCPKALFGIGTLPDTVADRSFLIRMRRKKRTDKVERFRLREGAVAGRKLAERLEAWAATRVNALRRARPALPDALGDRAQDAAEPLLALADAAGGSWPEEARAAVVALAGARDPEDETAGVRLLADVRRVLDLLRRTEGHIATADLLRELNALPEAEWTRFVGGREPLDAPALARLLRPYGARPRVVREGAATPRGYLVSDLADAFGRYLPEVEAEGATAPEPAPVAPPVAPPLQHFEPLQQRVVAPLRPVAEEKPVPRNGASSEALRDLLSGLRERADHDPGAALLLEVVEVAGMAGSTPTVRDVENALSDRARRRPDAVARARAALPLLREVLP